MEAEGQGVCVASRVMYANPQQCMKPHPLISIQPAVPVELLAKLGVLLGKNWQKALQVVDQHEVQCYQAEPSGRRIFEVSQD